MVWCGYYLTVAALVAAAAFVIADYLRIDGEVAPDSPGTTSLVAGALWPIFVVGATELAFVAFVSRWHRAH